MEEITILFEVSWSMVFAEYVASATRAFQGFPGKDATRGSRPGAKGGDTRSPCTYYIRAADISRRRAE